ncbi:hypothetical protein [Fervidobacterium thailandense]|uniref:Beta-1,6-galactofuranosyltransferase n=1 Tax=Fervidobacterium thailandense TaxID=1008305 RepID=A0A1E3G0R3_9BACT|nr:hypothetical protein [Fervidobacterium thailandense]ODN29839.1 hypothetical protein A4H02_08495 [Fervidobacterium thailandense]
MKSQETYYVSAFFWENFNAALKAKLDVERIFRRMNFKPIDLFKDGKKIRVLSITKLFKLVLSSFFTKEYEYSNVFFQNGTGIDLFLAPILKLAFRKGKRIIVIHDVESIRFSRKIDFLREKFVFSKFTHAICHSKQMADFLREKIGFNGTLFVIELFDYILESLPNTSQSPSLGGLPFPDDRKFLVVYAGNLSKWKSGFLYKIAQGNSKFKNYRLVLYGKGFDTIVQNENIELKGAFPPDELPYHLKGHFGLIWDGEETKEISGTVGNYLRYNSPHKASLYIVTGLPLICWKEAAVYDVVKKYNIGFGIHSLEELDEILENISEKEYNLWRENVMNLRNQLAQGKNLEKVINQILGS